MAIYFKLRHNKYMQRSAQKRRRPLGAALLSLASLGLGQIYNGELAKGILLKALMTAAICLHALRLRMDGSRDLLFLGVLVLIFLVLKAYSVGQSFRFARIQGAGYTLKSSNRVPVYVGLTLLFLALAIAIPQAVRRHVYTDYSGSHPFRSARAKVRFLDLYDRKAERWPIASESRMVETSFGRTFLRISGPEDAPPLVLLHGIGGSSLQWWPNIEGLSADFRTFAIDNIYDNGRSIYTFIFQTPDDFIRWMDELFDALGLGNDINLVGLSYGGWLTSQYALNRPERLDSIVLVAPVSTVMPLQFDWIWHASLCMIPHPHFVQSFMDWMLPDLAASGTAGRALLDEETEGGFLASQCFKPKPMVNPTVLTDEEWRDLKVPALFLVGENEKIYPAEKAVNRLARVAPQIKTAILPGCGHDLTVLQAGLVNRRILDFLKTP